jgi:hypothetical protein
LHDGFGDAALRAREHEFVDHHDEVPVEPADFTNIPNPLQQTFDRRAIREEQRKPKREIDDDAPIPNPLQQTFDTRALKADRAVPAREVDDEDAPIPNPLQQTYDKRFANGGGAARLPAQQAPSPIRCARRSATSAVMRSWARRRAAAASGAAAGVHARGAESAGQCNG